MTDSYLSSHTASLTATIIKLYCLFTEAHVWKTTCPGLHNLVKWNMQIALAEYNNNNKLVLMPLIQDNLGEPATETFRIHAHLLSPN